MKCKLIQTFKKFPKSLKLIKRSQVSPHIKRTIRYVTES
jgi:hypothetical protein